MGEEELIKACEQLDIHVAYLPYHLAGAYFHAERLIIVDAAMSPARQRETLTHEYVHALHGHDGAQPAHIEARVDMEAAQLLISPIEYQLAEHLHGENVAAIAEELGVTRDLVRSYRKVIARSAATPAPMPTLSPAQP